MEYHIVETNHDEPTHVIDDYPLLKKYNFHTKHHTPKDNEVAYDNGFITINSLEELTSLVEDLKGKADIIISIDEEENCEKIELYDDYRE